MNPVQGYGPATITKIAWALFFLIAAGCTHDSRTITGQVVDESDTALSDVAVTACYSGWGWSAGYLVWDKDYCSEPVRTDSAGLYVINFKGPGSMRLLARKEGWIQTQDFNTAHTRVILTRNEDHSARQAEETRLRDQEHRQRLPGESDTEYYCRVILPGMRPVTLEYQGESLSIAPNLLKLDDHREALFVLRGSSGAASSFSDEVILRVNGATANGLFSLKPVATSCESDVHFIGVTVPGWSAGRNEQVGILVPSIRAMVDLQIWSPSEKP